MLIADGWRGWVAGGRGGGEKSGLTAFWVRVLGIGDDEPIGARLQTTAVAVFYGFLKVWKVRLAGKVGMIGGGSRYSTLKTA